MLAGCATAPDALATAEPEAAPGGMIDILDLEGTAVSVPVPGEIDSIVETSGGQGVLGTAILLGQLDKVTGTPGGRVTPWLGEAYPELANIPDYGRFNDVNVEEVLQAGPDAIIAPVSGTETIDKLRELDMPVLVSGLPSKDEEEVFQQIYDQMDMMAELTGSEQTAADYYAWAGGLLDLVDERVSDIPDSERVSVLATRSDITQVYGSNAIWGAVVEMAGGVNPAAELTYGTGKMNADVDAEQLVEWNPEMMFQINMPMNNDEAFTMMTGWSEDSRLNGMQVFDNKNVYLIPAGLDSWSSAIEAPLGVLWMAQIMYPDRFADMDVMAEADAFYATFLGYEMTDEDWALMAAQPPAYNPNGLTP